MVALTLNLRLDDIECIDETGDLGTWALPDEFCTVSGDGCPTKHETPEAFVGWTALEVLVLANEALGGADISPYSISQVNDIVSWYNETFDECREVVSCPTEEICDNGCDDDFNGDTDCDDESCTGDPACPVIIDLI